MDELNRNDELRPGLEESVKSEEVQEIMGQVPGWIVRQGSTLIFAISVLILFGAYFIKYPDIVRGEITISFSDPPVKLIARSNGKIQQLFVANNAVVKTDDPICLLENPCSFDDVIRLKTIIKRLDSLIQNSGDFTKIDFNIQSNLGDMHAQYIDLYLAYQQYLFLVNEEPHKKQIEQFRVELKYAIDLDKQLEQKERLLKKQLIVEQKKFEIDSLLAKDSVSTPLEYHNSQLKLLSQTLNTQTIEFSALENRMQQVELNRNILQLNQSLIQAQNDIKYKIYESIRKLEETIADWEQKYLLKAPTEGKVNFFKFWNENQFVEASEAVAIVIPNSDNFTCKARVPISGAGKIVAGQRVLIKLSAYPHQEFGVIVGKVISISDIPLDDYYSMEVKLINGLVTNRNIKIPTHSLIVGEGEVLTNNRSILQRIFDRIVSVGTYNS